MVTLILHLYDSLSLYPYTQKHQHIMDVGSGAGLPGILLAIAQPNLEFTLVESSHKRCAFLRHIKHKLNLSNIIIKNKRVELLTSSKPYHLVLTRAFAPLDIQWKYISHLLEKDAYILAMKGTINKNEILRSINNIHAIIKLPCATKIKHRHLIQLK